MNNLLGIEEAPPSRYSQWTLRYFVRAEEIANIKIGRESLSRKAEPQRFPRAT